MWRELSFIGMAVASVAFRQCETKSKKAQSQTHTSSETALYIKVARTPCFGRCPIDVVELLPDGTVRYEGERFVSRLGVYTRRLSAAERKEAERILRESSFHQYAEVYDNPGITDLPSLILVYRLEGSEKKITCRTGCPPDLPEKIERLRAFLADQGDFQMVKGPQEETLSDPGND
ncbi:MAG: DUF6438 domain-containing protein [Bacteroidia bacterium]|nr:DUF6438 domain-containing protein [Bacteroidia bacterium]